MRVFLDSPDLKKLFGTLAGLSYTVIKLARMTGFSGKTISDWRRGKHTMPQSVYKQLIQLACTEGFSSVVLVDEKQQKSRAGKVGGRAQWVKNGSIGTLDDKKSGGRASYNKRRFNKDDIFTLVAIKKPNPSEKLAEFMGIMIGDGSVGPYQATVSLNMTDDAEFVTHVAGLAEELFGICPTVQVRKKSNCSVVTLSSKLLVEYLQAQGLPMGDKIRAGLDIPNWIMCDSNYARLCLRGIFDTDGSIFLETHNIKGKKYSYPRMSFVSYSEPLIESIFEALLRLGFEPRVRMGRKVNLERFTDIEKYFKIVGSSNPKHLRRFAEFGGVG